MRILFKQILIQDSRSSFFGKKVDLLAGNGRWLDIASSIQAEADEVISGSDFQWFPSLVDLRVHNTLPGGEHKEDWTSLQAAAWKGGVLDMLLLPTGDPVFVKGFSFCQMSFCELTGGCDVPDLDEVFIRSFANTPPDTLNNTNKRFTRLK